LGAAANDDPGDGFGGGVKFLVGKVGGYENEVTGTHGFGAFAVAAPADLSIAAEDVNDGFLVAVVVHGTSGVWLGDHYAATDMGGAGKIAVNGSEAQNACGLRRVAVEVIAAGNANVGHRLAPEFGCRDVKTRCTLQGQSGGVLGHEGNFAVFLASGFHGDLDVLAEGGEKVHETFDGKGTGAVAHQDGNMRLLDAEDLASFCLLEGRVS